MEYVSGIKIRTILLHNGNWWKFFLKHRHLIRTSIIINILKLLVCRTTFLGYHLIVCPKCFHNKKVPHSCKSKFCSSCGKKGTDNWIKNKFNTLPKTKWQHITFSIDERLWPFFWHNRYLLNKIPAIAAHIMKTLAAQKDFLPGIFIALHTFGRDLKRNPHIHLSTTAGGLRISDKYKSWVPSAFFYHAVLKAKWKHAIISLLLNEFNKGNLKLPNNLKHIKSTPSFYSWLQISYKKTWVVHLQKQSFNMKHNIAYLGKYLKRPPIGETRIKNYDGKFVTYHFLDHYTNTTQYIKLPAHEFIARLIAHIPDKYFRNIRYYGFLSNRASSKLLPIVYTLLKMSRVIITKNSIRWKDLIKKTFFIDPTACPSCKSQMQFSLAFFPKQNILAKHKDIAHGYFPLL